MRSSEEMKKIILGNANADTRIRAVLLNGSRANHKVEPDRFQDYDIVYLVDQMESFITDHAWTSVFGEKLIWQLPDEMELHIEGAERSFAFHYLMLLKDGNRIDLTLFPLERFETDFKWDSLTVIWLDKDNLFLHAQPPTDKDYRISRPTEKEYMDACNEFWWVCTYVVKGLLRKEISYAKAMMENPVRRMFMKIIEWRIGVDTNFSVSFGKDGKYMHKYLAAGDYNNILKTYPDFKTENIWNSLFLMTDLFSGFAIELADKLMFKYNLGEEENSMAHLEALYNESVRLE